MDGKLFNSKGVQVGVVTGGAIYGLEGHKLYELKGANIYKLSGELMGHLNASRGSEMRLDRFTDKLFLEKIDHRKQGSIWSRSNASRRRVTFPPREAMSWCCTDRPRWTGNIRGAELS